MKGRGWLVTYPVGDRTPHNGVPTIAAERWDTGVQVRVGRPAFEGAVAYTVGSLSDPRVSDNNSGGQIAGRVAWHPGPAFSLGVSAARGVFVADNVRDARPDAPAGYDDQRAFGVDAEASWGRWLVRGEYVANAWRVPPLDAPRIVDPLGSRAGYVEARLRLHPRLYAAVRGDVMRFTSLEGSGGRRALGSGRLAARIRLRCHAPPRAVVQSLRAEQLARQRTRQEQPPGRRATAVLVLRPMARTRPSSIVHASAAAVAAARRVWLSGAAGVGRSRRDDQRLGRDPRAANW